MGFDKSIKKTQKNLSKCISNNCEYYYMSPEHKKLTEEHRKDIQSCGKMDKTNSNKYFNCLKKIYNKSKLKVYNDNIDKCSETLCKIEQLHLSIAFNEFILKLKHNNYAKVLIIEEYLIQKEKNPKLNPNTFYNKNKDKFTNKIKFNNFLKEHDMKRIEEKKKIYIKSVKLVEKTIKDINKQIDALNKKSATKSTKKSAKKSTKKSTKKSAN